MPWFSEDSAFSAVLCHSTAVIPATYCPLTHTYQQRRPRVSGRPHLYHRIHTRRAPHRTATVGGAQLGVGACPRKPGPGGHPRRGTETVTAGGSAEGLAAGVGSDPPQGDGRSGGQRRRREEGQARITAGAVERGGTAGARASRGATAETVRRIWRSGARCVCVRVCMRVALFLCLGGKVDS